MAVRVLFSTNFVKVIKDLDAIVDTKTNSDHCLVSAVVDIAGITSPFVLLLKKLGQI